LKTPGRNDPCPCGSGKKYKKCCLRPAGRKADSDIQATAVARALDFLHRCHRRAAKEALDSFLEPSDERELPALDRNAAEVLEIARFEWLLAEAEIEVHGLFLSAYEVLVGAQGPPLSTAEKEALRELSERPRRLYEVTAVRSGESIALRDVVTIDAESVTVEEQTASGTLSPGDLLAARLVRRQGDGAWTVSGPLYALPRAYLQPLREAIREVEARQNPDDQALAVSDVLTVAWVQHLTRGLPEVVYAATGEEILLTTDHYRVRDRTALLAALRAQDDVQCDGGGGGDGSESWSRVDQTTERLLCGLSLQEDRLHVLAPTKGLADDSREWLQGIAGRAVEFRIREHVDPLSEKAGEAVADRPGDSVEIPPEVRQELIEEHYTDWGEDAIPALGDLTPSEAMATELGRERLTELLLDYEHSEQRQSEWEKREPVSFEFLWRRIGLR
jgi:hypothetical protein